MMKDLSNSITEILKGSGLSQRKKFDELAKGIGADNLPVNDVLFKEFIQQVNDGIDSIQSCAKKGILDLLPPVSRKQLFDSLVAFDLEANNLLIQKARGNEISHFVNAGNGILVLITSWSLDILLNELPEYTEKLQELKDLRKKLSNLLLEFNGSKKIIDDAQTLLTTLNDTYTKNAESFNSITTIKGTVEKIGVELDKKKLECESSVTTIETFFKSFTELVKKISDEKTGFQATIALVEKTKDDITRIHGEASELNKALQTNIIDYGVSIKNLKSLETSIQSLYDKALDPEEGIEKSLEKVNDIKSKTDDLYSKIKQSHEIAGELEGKIKVLHDNSEKNALFIDKAKIDTEDKKKKIEEIYNIVANTSRGGMFNDARKSFETEQGKWLSYLKWSVGLTVVVAICISAYFADRNLATTTIANYFLRYAILSPLIYAIIFCGKQYKLAHTSFEKYTFKTVVSFSLENDITVMQNRFREDRHEDAILKSTLEKLTKLYDEPYYDEAAKMKFKIKQDEVRFGKDNENELMDTDEGDITDNEIVTKTTTTKKV